MFRVKASISEAESELLLVTSSNDNHSPGPVMRDALAVTREANLAAEMRLSVSEFQSLIDWGKTLHL